MFRILEITTNCTILCTHVSVEYEDNPIEHIPNSSVDLYDFFGNKLLLARLADNPSAVFV